MKVNVCKMAFFGLIYHFEAHICHLGNFVEGVVNKKLRYMNLNHLYPCITANDDLIIFLHISLFLMKRTPDNLDIILTIFVR